MEKWVVQWETIYIYTSTVIGQFRLFPDLHFFRVGNLCSLDRMMGTFNMLQVAKLWWPRRWNNYFRCPKICWEYAGGGCSFGKKNEGYGPKRGNNEDANDVKIPTVAKVPNMFLNSKLLGDGFKYFLFSPLFGEDSSFDYFCSMRLVQPPSRLCLFDLPLFSKLPYLTWRVERTGRLRCWFLMGYDMYMLIAGGRVPQEEKILFWMVFWLKILNHKMEDHQKVFF